MAKVDIYEQVTAQMIQRIEQDNLAPWNRPWALKASWPKNFVSKRQYNGINVLLLLLTQHSTPYWLTFNQARNLGGTVRKGEKGTHIVFWKQFQRTDEQDPDQKRMVLVARQYTVFNFDQTEGIEAPPELRSETQTDKGTPQDLLWRSYPNPPAIKHLGDQAFYDAARDTVVMPPVSEFHSQEHYHATLYHELIHSTGHRDRLDRSTLKDATFFGDLSYCKEELVAEMGAAMMCGLAGIENVLPNSAAYLKGWLRRLKEEPRWLVQAASQAQRAVDHILGEVNED